MKVNWTRSEGKSEYYYGTTSSRFSVQIGQSTEAGKYVWLIFHEDFKYCVHNSDSVKSVEEAKTNAAQWLEEWATKNT